MRGKTEIKLQGRIDIRWKDWFEGMDVLHINNYTILQGHIKDQSSLHGVLNRIRDLNLKLISVNPIETKNKKS